MVNCITLHQVFNSCHPPPHGHDDACFPSFTARHHFLCWQSQVRCCLAKIMWQEVYYCVLIPPGSPRKNNLEISSLVIEAATKYDMLFPQRSAAKTHAVSATEPHLFRPLQITYAQYQHEDTMLLKQVSSTSDHSGKNDLGVVRITLYFHS